MTEQRLLDLSTLRQEVRQLEGLFAYDITGVGGTRCSMQFGLKYQEYSEAGNWESVTVSGDFYLEIFAPWQILRQGKVVVSSKLSFLQAIGVKEVAGLWTLDGQTVREAIITDSFDLRLTFSDEQALQVTGMLKSRNTEVELVMLGWDFSRNK